jgi:hypothetical protein
MMVNWLILPPGGWRLVPRRIVLPIVNMLGYSESNPFWVPVELSIVAAGICTDIILHCDPYQDASLPISYLHVHLNNWHDERFLEHYLGIDFNERRAPAQIVNYVLRQPCSFTTL